MSKKKPEEEKVKMGRPEIWTLDKCMELGNDLLQWLKKTDNYFITEFLVENGLYKQIVADLSDKFPDFSVLIKKAKEIQESKLVKKGLEGVHNPTMTIFVLKNHHDYKDKSEQNINVNKVGLDAIEDTYE